MTIYDLKKIMADFHLNDFSTASLDLINKINSRSELKEMLGSVVENSAELSELI